MWTLWLALAACDDAGPTAGEGADAAPIEGAAAGPGAEAVPAPIPDAVADVAAADVAAADVAGEPGAPAMTESPLFEVLDRQVSDTEQKTQVALRVRIPGGLPAAELEARLHAAYTAALASGGFRHRAHPDAVYVFAYDTAAWSADPTGWVASLQKPAGVDTPELTLAPRALDFPPKAGMESAH